MQLKLATSHHSCNLVAGCPTRLRGVCVFTAAYEAPHSSLATRNHNLGRSMVWEVEGLNDLDASSI